ncbi:MAG: DUF2207 domain-containing protein [Peptostreptococcaceae bacterium]|nr:DUF2207 domain-containing protein [Peptostreptococcaceae bacterium]
MKRQTRWIVSILLIGMFCLSTAFAYASEKINSIDIDVLLNDDGSADITQVWDIETNKGTEFYITMSRMGDMQVQDFRVTDETGREFTFVGEDWDIDGSLEDKAYLCGFHPIGDGFEMCWGKGSYGEHTYTLQYRLTNLVKSYPDYDGFNTRFINDQISPDVQSATVTIRFADASRNVHLNADEAGIWSFGHQGTILFEDGKVVARTSEAIGKYNYLNILMRIEKGLIRPVSQGQGTFAELEDRAKGGSDYEESSASGIIVPVVIFFVLLVFALPWLLVMFGIYKVATSVGQKPEDKNMKKDFRRMGGDLKRVEYSRALPMDGSLAATQWSIAKVGGKIREKDVLGAYLLRLIRHKAIIPVISERQTILGNTREEFSLKIQDGMLEEDTLENSLLSILRSASGQDRILQEKELKTWARKNYTKVQNWLLRIDARGEEIFRTKQGFEMRKKGTFFRKLVRELTPAGFDMIDRSLGFRKMLEDFTLISERQVKEVELWDDYLVYAALFGMADEVSKQMKDIYPDFEKISALSGGGYYFGSTMGMISTMNNAIYSGYSSGYSASTSRSSGGGGFSSGGGGGGFSGGGSGGGSR